MVTHPSEATDNITPVSQKGKIVEWLSVCISRSAPPTLHVTLGQASLCLSFLTYEKGKITVAPAFWSENRITLNIKYLEEAIALGKHFLNASSRDCCDFQRPYQLSCLSKIQRAREADLSEIIVCIFNCR